MPNQHVPCKGGMPIRQHGGGTGTVRGSGVELRTGTKHASTDAMLVGREHDQRPYRRDCCTLVVDACTDTRHALIEIMLAEGYPSIGTSRIREACTLIQSLNIELVVVNTSTFPADAIHCLRQATHRRRPAQLLAAVSYISMTGKPRRAFHFLRVADPTQIPVGIHSTDRN
jgi:hypothetical protein